MNRHLRGRIALCSAIMASACGSVGEASIPGWCATETDARIVLAPTQSQVLEVSEVWRRGGQREGEILSFPWPPAVGSGGWIAVPDVALRTVVVLDSLGNWIGPVTTGGQGPGEASLPAAAVWESHDQLAVLDVGDASIVRLRAPAFDLIEDVRVSGRLIGAASQSGEILSLFLDERARTGMQLRGSRTQEGRVLEALQALESADGSVDTLIIVETTAVSSERRWGNVIAPGHLTPIASAGPGAAIALAGDVPEYRVRVLGEDLTDSLVVCREVSGEGLSAAERGDTTADAPILEALRTAPKPATPQTIGRLFFGSGGELWVQRTRPSPLRLEAPPEGAIYDYFDADGTYRGTVAAPSRMTFYGQVGSLIVAYERGEFDEISVVALRLLGI